ncbi:MAG: hypothetical protein C0448_00210 [Sphingobacteriaceae bacterium]|nr:hypothetical protein [Sphingobacteriaceae bacterium]
MKTKLHLKFLLIIIYSFMCIEVTSQTSKIDSLKKVLLLKKDTAEVNCLNQISKEFSSSNLDSCIKYYEIALSKVSKISYPKGLARGLLLKAYMYRRKGEVDSAMVIYNEVIKLSNQHNLIQESGESYMFIGFMLQNQSEYDQSIINLITAEKQFEKIKNNSLLGRNSWMLGNTYLKLKSYTEAENSFKKAQGYFGKLGDSLGYFDCVLNTSIIFNEKGELEKALKLILQSERHYRAVKHIGALSAALINKAEVLTKTHKYKEAEIALLEALELKKMLGAPLGVSTCLLNLANLYEATKDYKKAEQNYFNAIDLARKDNTQNVILMSYKGLYKIYKLQNNTKLALDYHEKYMSLNDSIYNSDKNQIIEEMKTKYETEKKDKQIVQKNSEIQKSVLELEQKSFERNAFLIGLFLVLILVVVAFVAYRQKKHANTILFQQNNEITIQKQLIQEQKHKVEEHQKETLDSINYAKRIQYALLANDSLLKNNLNEHFVLFSPKDIVSGDFYWATEHNNKFYLAVCDSTGHGVPGAFMSLLNIGFLNEAIKEKNISDPNEILNYVRTRLIDSIGNDGQQDGMDAILICFDHIKSSDLEQRTISYAAANNEPVLIRGNEIIELPKDKMPVGKGERMNSFTLQTLKVNKGDVLYLYTDGYADQFGGPKGKKFKYKPLNELLLLMSNDSAKQQKDLLVKTFFDWKGSLEQVDDVCIIGIKL